MKHTYLMRARPFGIGTFPKVKIDEVQDGTRSKDGYWSKVTTAEKLTPKQIADFELIEETA